MKQIFDWLREQFGKIIGEVHSPADVVWNNAVKMCIAKIDEAEAKWGCHAICYLDSPCEYQNEDIRVDEADCCEWEHRENYVNCLCKCNGIMVEHNWAIGFKFCPYCGKPIKIVEVE